MQVFCQMYIYKNKHILSTLFLDVKGSIDSFPFCLPTSPSPHPPSPHTPLCGRDPENMAADVNTEQRSPMQDVGEKCATGANAIAQGKKGGIHIYMIENGKKTSLYHL